MDCQVSKTTPQVRHVDASDVVIVRKIPCVVRYPDYIREVVE